MTDRDDMERWVASAPDEHLTWGRWIDGRAFMAQVEIADGADVVELGPGYGRLIAAARELELPFGSWSGVDVSAASIAHLHSAYPESWWIVDDFRSGLPEGDVYVSSLVFKHLAPDFSPALEAFVRARRPGARLYFDVPEGPNRTQWEPHGGAFLHEYSRDRIAEMAAPFGLQVEFGYVVHDPEGHAHRRLMVVAS